jgi:DNA/RNA endonuclease YhcR with UshA esterase domain
VKGTLKEYRGRPEIVLDQVSQITIIDDAPAGN